MENRTPFSLNCHVAKEEVDTYEQPYDPDENTRAQVLWMKSLRRIQTQVLYTLYTLYSVCIYAYKTMYTEHPLLSSQK